MLRELLLWDWPTKSLSPTYKGKSGKEWKKLSLNRETQGFFWEHAWKEEKSNTQLPQNGNQSSMAETLTEVGVV